MNEPSVTSDRIAGWLYEQALPLWSQAGLDRESGGFVETLSLDHKPGFDRPKRMLVQARQIFVYSYAHLIATDTHHEPAARFRLDRFNTGLVMDEEAKGSQHNLH